MKLLLTLVLSCICYCTQAQYFPEHNIFVTPVGSAVCGLEYIEGTVFKLRQEGIDLTNPETITRLAAIAKEKGGNVIQLGGVVYKSKKRLATKYRHEITIYILKTAYPEQVRAVSEKHFYDSVCKRMIKDPSKQAMVVVYTALASRSYEWPADYFKFRTESRGQIEGCLMNPHTICTYDILKEEDIKIRDKYYTESFMAKFGNMYFLEIQFITKFDGVNSITMRRLMPVDVFRGYYSCLTQMRRKKIADAKAEEVRMNEY